jgi:hypothetical protein
MTMFYQVATNPGVAEMEPLFLGRHRAGFQKALVTTFLSSDQHITFVYM